MTRYHGVPRPSGIMVATTAIDQTAIMCNARSDQLAAEMKATRFRRGILGRRSRYVTVYGPDGRPAGRIHIHDSGNSEHDLGSRQDAVVRPDAIRVRVSVAESRSTGGIAALPAAIRAAARIYHRR